MREGSAELAQVLPNERRQYPFCYLQKWILSSRFSRTKMAFEVFNVGDRVAVDGPNGPRLFIAEVLQGQWAGYFYLRYSQSGAVMERDGQKKKFHRSALMKATEVEGPRGNT
jgi:hypothetical protein